ncbi:MAG: FGGY-family carbohydrate kinase [Lachnospiraceae bacterium]|nr:FGGY-family carbohydrate kinase [Lachnospiraceae bacterium]
MADVKSIIEEGKTALGIEFGSTRIKAVLVDESGKVLAQGDHGWENQYENGIWTYSLDMVWDGLADAYANLASDVKSRFDADITKTAAIGFSAMMHGYLAFDKDGNLLAPFRTWRNTITEESAAALTKEFGFNIPQRWSIAHLYQAILNGEEHVKDISFFTTLAGYVHWVLTGEKVLGVGDASGMFPIDSASGDYNKEYLDKFRGLVKDKGFGWDIADILPRVLTAGDNAGVLSAEGAAKLDRSGKLSAGIPLCPPEGDAGTGMVATNSVSVRTGNVSAGTSVFAMVVMEKPLSKVHEQIDVVTTPVGDDVAMVHCNNCTSDINAWANLFKEYSQAMGMEVDMNKLYTTMFTKALDGDTDCGGLYGFNYFSGEPVTGFEAGRPVFMREVNAKFTFANFMRLHLYSAVSTLKYGLDILFKEEKAAVDRLYGHGGFFKTKEAGARILSAATAGPVTVMETAGEGGAWGMALLALYLVKEDKKGLSDFLTNEIFAGEKEETVMATEDEIRGFDKFMEGFVKTLPVQRAAIDALGE